MFLILLSTWQYAEYADCQISGLKIHSTLPGKDIWGPGFETFEHEGKVFEWKSWPSCNLDTGKSLLWKDGGPAA